MTGSSFTQSLIIKTNSYTTISLTGLTTLDFANSHRMKLAVLLHQEILSNQLVRTIQIVMALPSHNKPYYLVITVDNKL